MAELPTGTVTFLFTDIEGSTKLWEQHPEAMQTALAQHDAILRQAIEDNGGYVFKTVGDAFCAAFPTAPEALHAALAAQRHLQSPLGDLHIKVRMGLHTGAAEERDNDYFGPTLNRIARLFSAGYGGQTILSLATYELVRDHLPAGAELRDLGEHRLKDLTRPERVFQLVVPDLPANFPPLKTLDTHPHNLPVQLTSFVGREKEIAEVKHWLGEKHLVTLTGPGGTGKTRLSLQVAADLLDAFPNGVWLVELAPLADPALVPQTVATALGVREQQGRPVQDTLTDYLREKNLLLILDNCEHLVEACAQLAEALLHACPGLKILASSREALGIAGEVPFGVPSLSTPDLRHLPPLETLSQYEAVRLFIERAETALPGFTVTNQNAPALAQVCHRLDGIPLAIELAAARVKVLRVEQIAARLDDRFRLLTGGSRTALPRQQTLRALIDWSYDLLSESERVLLQRLSVFAGGWTLEAAEAVCADDLTPNPSPERRGESTPPSLTGKGVGGIGPMDILDLLTQLANKSLVVVEREQGAEARYRLLETVRQYAREKLAETGEGNRVRSRHLNYFLQFAEEAEPHLLRAEQLDWLARLEQEHDNLRVALEWALSGESVDPLMPAEAGLRLTNALWCFWFLRGYWQEGREWFGQAMAAPSQLSRTIARARAPARATWFEQDLRQNAQLAGESLTLCRELGDRPGIADALRVKGLLFGIGDYVSARLVLEESLTLYRELGDKWGIARVFYYFGQIAHRREHNTLAAHHFYDESLRLNREIGDRRGIALSLNNLGLLASDQGNWSAALAFYEESLYLARELKDKYGIAMRLSSLGILALGQGDYLQAVKRLEESLAIAQELGDKSEIALALCILGRVARFQGDYEQAAKLLKEGLTIRREAGNKWDIAWVLCCLGELARLQDDYVSARAFYTEAVPLAREVDVRGAMAYLIEEFAALSAAQGQAQRAATLFGAAEALREAIHRIPLPVERAEIDRNIAAARAQLDEAMFNAAWAEGRAMTMEQAIQFALQVDT